MSKLSKMMGGGAKGDQRSGREILPEVPVKDDTPVVKSASDVIPLANDRKRRNSIALGL